MINRTKWLQISLETRSKLAELFGMSRSGFNHILDNEVISDGYSDKDLAMLSLEKLQQYLGSEEEDYYKLLDLVIKQIENPHEKIEKTDVDEYVQPGVIKVKRGRPKKIPLI